MFLIQRSLGRYIDASKILSVNFIDGYIKVVFDNGEAVTVSKKCEGKFIIHLKEYDEGFCTLEDLIGVTGDDE